MGPALQSSADFQKFSQLVSDWDARCPSRKYYKSDMSVVESELQQERPRLVEQGLAMLPSRAQSESASGSLNPYKPDHARRIQQRLRELGYYTQAVDGDWGPGSRDALEAFKWRQGLARNDLWDEETQRRLFAATID
jgi:hypothetical protein